MTDYNDDLPYAAKRSPVAWVSDLIKDTIIKVVKDADEVTQTVTETVFMPTAPRVSTQRE